MSTVDYLFKHLFTLAYIIIAFRKFSPSPQSFFIFSFSSFFSLLSRTRLFHPAILHQRQGYNCIYVPV